MSSLSNNIYLYTSFTRKNRIFFMGIRPANRYLRLFMLTHKKKSSMLIGAVVLFYRIPRLFSHIFIRRLVVTESPTFFFHLFFFSSPLLNYVVEYVTFYKENTPAWAFFYICHRTSLAAAFAAIIESFRSYSTVFVQI